MVDMPNKFNKEKILLMVHVCEMYYKEGCTQEEIGKRLKISRSQISRILTQAREANIVHVTIRNPFSLEETYAEKLKMKYALSSVVVTASEATDPREGAAATVTAAARLLESLLNDTSVVGVMAGKTVRDVCGAVHFSHMPKTKIVPVMGGWGIEGSNWHANSNAYLLGSQLRCKYYVMNAPSIVSMAESRQALMREPEIYRVLNLAKSADIVLMGIGQLDSNSTMYLSEIFSEDKLESIRSHGAVGNIMSNFIDQRGKVIDIPGLGFQIGLDMRSLRSIPNRVAVAFGQQKAEAIHAALRGGWATSFVTDIATAKLLTDYT